MCALSMQAELLGCPAVARICSRAVLLLRPDGMVVQGQGPLRAHHPGCPGQHLRGRDGAGRQELPRGRVDAA
jgi:hypothetical protein